MIDKTQKNRIEARALEIYEWRCANGILGCSLDDWLQAELELCDKRQVKNCPVDGYPLFREDDKVICPKSGCTWQVDSKRDTDKHLPDFAEIKKDWR